MERAAELIGEKRTKDMMADTAIPIQNGWSVVIWLMASPRSRMKTAMRGPTKSAVKPPERIATAGTSRMSSFVLPATRWASSAPTKTARKAPTGPALTPSTVTL